MLPDRMERCIATLQFEGCLLCPLTECRIYLGFRARCRIDILQLGNRKWRLRRILAGIIRVKIYQIRLTVMQLLDDQSHLQSPVTQMHIADDMVSHIAADALDALSDDRGT